MSVPQPAACRSLLPAAAYAAAACQACRRRLPSLRRRRLEGSSAYARAHAHAHTHAHTQPHMLCRCAHAPPHAHTRALPPKRASCRRVPSTSTSPRLHHLSSPPPPLLAFTSPRLLAATWTRYTTSSAWRKPVTLRRSHSARTQQESTCKAAPLSRSRRLRTA